MKTFLPCFIISLVIHLILLFLIPLPRYDSISLLESQSPVWIELQDKERKTVDIRPPAWEQKPKESGFLGMYDSTVPEEMVAQGHGLGPLGEEKRKAKNKDSVETPDIFDFDKGIFSIPSQNETEETSEDAFLKGSLPEEYFPDLKKGQHTYLNVMRFQGAAYIVRLRRVIQMTWNPFPVLKELYFKDRIVGGKVETTLGVSLDKQGNLAELFLFKSSGIEQFDQEALRSIRASSPFSSLSPEISQYVDEEGLFRMAWTFTVYL